MALIFKFMCIFRVTPKTPGKKISKVKKDEFSPVITAVAGSSSGTARTSSLQQLIMEEKVQGKMEEEVDSTESVQAKFQTENMNMKTEGTSAEVNLSSVPRLVGNSTSAEISDIDPQKWSIQDVAGFLQANDCGSYCDGFRKNVCHVFVDFGYLLLE